LVERVPGIPMVKDSSLSGKGGQLWPATVSTLRPTACVLRY